MRSARRFAKADTASERTHGVQVSNMLPDSNHRQPGMGGLSEYDAVNTQADFELTQVERHIKAAYRVMQSDVSGWTPSDLQKTRRLFAQLLHPDKQPLSLRNSCSSAFAEMNAFLDQALREKLSQTPSRNDGQAPDYGKSA